MKLTFLKFVLFQVVLLRDHELSGFSQHLMTQVANARQDHRIDIVLSRQKHELEYLIAKQLIPFLLIALDNAVVKRPDQHDFVGENLLQKLAFFQFLSRKVIVFDVSFVVLPDNQTFVLLVDKQ